MTQNERDKIKNSVAAQLGAHYSRVCSWANKADLQQEAWLAMLLADRSYDETKGNYRGYVYIAAQRWLGGYIAAEGSPVSTKTLAERKELHGLRSVSVILAREIGGSGNEDERHGLTDFAMQCAGVALGVSVFDLAQPDAVAERNELREKVVARLAPLLEADPEHEMALAVILGEETSAEVAERCQISVGIVYAAARRARRRIAADAQLTALFVESFQP